MVTRTSLVTNPSAEVNTTGWSTANNGTVGTLTLTRVADTAPAGSWVFNLGATGLGVNPALGTAVFSAAAVPGQQHAAQAQIRWVSGSAPAGATARLRLQYRAGVTALATYDAPTVPATQLTYVLRELVASAVAPATTDTVRLEVQMIGGTASGAASVRFDAVLLELGSVSLPYFDGSTTDTATTRYDWTGTAHASTSTATPWIDATLVASGAPNPVQLVLTGIPNGVAYEVVGSAGGRTWPVPGGAGTSTGGQVVLVDNRSALNTPITYTATWGGVTYTSAPITVPYAGRYVMQSLDGQTVIPFVWRDNALPEEYVIRSAAFDVPGRDRPAIRYSTGGDGGGALEIRTAPAATAELKNALKAGRPLVVRTDGTIRDFPAVELILPDQASSRSWGALTASGAPSPDRVWDLRFLLVDDPEPGTALSAWTWDDFDAAMAARTWADFDALFASSTWDQFDTYPWGQL